MDRPTVVERVEQLIATLDDPSAAYVVRSRLDRVLLLVRRAAVAECEGTARAARLADLTQTIDEHFTAIRRRSEPFGEAWLANLEAARAALLDLRAELLPA